MRERTPPPWREKFKLACLTRVKFPVSGNLTTPKHEETPTRYMPDLGTSPTYLEWEIQNPQYPPTKFRKSKRRQFPSLQDVPTSLGKSVKSTFPIRQAATNREVGSRCENLQPLETLLITLVGYLKLAQSGPRHLGTNFTGSHSNLVDFLWNTIIHAQRTE